MKDHREKRSIQEALTYICRFDQIMLLTLTILSAVISLIFETTGSDKTDILWFVTILFAVLTTFQTYRIKRTWKTKTRSISKERNQYED